MDSYHFVRTIHIMGSIQVGLMSNTSGCPLVYLHECGDHGSSGKRRQWAQWGYFASGLLRVSLSQAVLLFLLIVLLIWIQIIRAQDL